jgi:uncharacterized integral membrane protein
LVAERDLGLVLSVVLFIVLVVFVMQRLPETSLPFLIKILRLPIG